MSSEAPEPQPPEPAPEETQPEPAVESVEVEVALQRSVRYGRVVIGGAVLGAVLATLACLLYPIAEDAEYTMGQAVGFFAVLGGAIGLGVGGIVALALGAVARRRRGTGVAIQSDVR
ncbi:MAG: hypothetical protein QM606_01840 [Leucobacter sp.]